MAEVLRVALLGAGYIAPHHVEALRALRAVELVSICDRALDRARGLAAAVGGVRAYAGLDEMLLRERPDAVHVLLPPPQHADAVRACLGRGIHVLAEKPLATSSSECESLAACARTADRCLGTSHNFLFSGVYERLRDDLRNGVLGRPDQIEIVWRKPLGQLHAGPSGGWLLADPTHVLFEVAPHAFAQLIDLCGEPERVEVSLGRPLALPGGGVFYRWWDVLAEAGRTRALIRFSFGDGFTEHSLHLRSAAAAAHVDFERNRYALAAHGAGSLDFDRLQASLADSARGAAQALRTFSDVARAKLGRGGGEPFPASIAAAVRAFYAGLGGALDPRLGVEIATRTVALAERVAAQSGLRGAAPAVPSRPGAAAPGPRPTALVLGGTGFIGRALVERLLRRGIAVRVLSRAARSAPPELAHAALEFAVGALDDADAVAAALDGIEVVFHLARGHGESFEEYLARDVEPTRALAEACLRRGVRRLVYVSSTVIFDASEGAGPIEDETPASEAVLGSNPYARAKAACEELLLALHRERGLGVVIARPAIVIGPGADPFHYGVGDWPHPFVCATWGRGRPALPLVLVGDVADALVACAETPEAAGRCFNLSGEGLLSAQEYLDELERSSGVRIRRSVAGPVSTHLIDSAKWALKKLARKRARPRPRLRAAWSRSAAAPIPCRAARSLLGWRPCADRARLIREGIEASVAAWLR